MARVRFRDPAGTVRIGERTADGVRAAGTTFDSAAVDLLAPVTPSKVLGVGRNYERQFETLDAEPPSRPRIWWKGGENVVSGPGDTVALPPGGDVVFEAELGVVIGEECRNVPEADALDVVAGYTCVDDLSDQAHVDDPTMLRVKSFDNAAPMGPVVAPPEDVPTDPRIRLWTNGEKRQDSADDDLRFSVPEVIAAFSERVTLRPDDVIMMGTPAGYAPLADGDHVRIEIEGVGTLEHDVEIPS